jgi:uncharacterized protein
MTPVDPGVACVYRSLVMHQRMKDVAYRFRYRVFSVLIDIDRISDVARATRFFSHNRWNLFSFHDRDHLPVDAAGLRPWVEGVLRQYGIDGAGLRIRLLCFPRFLGLVFNPLSLWYCERADGSPVAVVAEVRNTFGERHCYLLSRMMMPVRGRCVTTTPRISTCRRSSVWTPVTPFACRAPTSGLRS